MESDFFWELDKNKMSKIDFLKKVLKKCVFFLVLTDSVTTIEKHEKSPYHNIFVIFSTFLKKWKQNGNIWKQKMHKNDTMFRMWRRIVTNYCDVCMTFVTIFFTWKQCCLDKNSFWTKNEYNLYYFNLAFFSMWLKLFNLLLCVIILTIYDIE